MNDQSKDAKHRIVQTQFVGLESGGPRPDHEDFKTTSELKALGFSGVRNNNLSGEVEIWVDGEIKKILSRSQLLLNADAIPEAFQEIFGLDVVKFEGDR